MATPQDEVLLEAGIDRAHGLISALREDSDNVFIVLTARQLNPRLKIISRAMQERSQSKLMKAGANHVVMPENIGGFYMAKLISKPGAVEFFSFITNEYPSISVSKELDYFDLPEGLSREAHQRPEAASADRSQYHRLSRSVGEILRQSRPGYYPGARRQFHRTGKVRSSWKSCVPFVKRRLGMRSWLFQPVDSAGLAFFMIVFGILGFADVTGSLVYYHYMV